MAGSHPVIIALAAQVRRPGRGPGRSPGFDSQQLPVHCWTCSTMKSRATVAQARGTLRGSDA